MRILSLLEDKYPLLNSWVAFLTTKSKLGILSRRLTIVFCSFSTETL